jgi:HlyD family secretion protein
VLQVIDPASLWVKARIDQRQASGLRAGQPAQIVLRSDPGRIHRGRVARVDWVADPVTEERIANVVFDAPPAGIALGDLVEVTIPLGELRDAWSVPAAAVKRLDSQEGVWRVSGGSVRFSPVSAGITTLDGRRRILEGLSAGDEVVVHSERALHAGLKVRVVPNLVAANP